MRSQPNREHLDFLEKQLEGKRFAAMNQLKNKLYDFLESVDEGMVER